MRVVRPHCSALVLHYVKFSRFERTILILATMCSNPALHKMPWFLPVFTSRGVFWYPVTFFASRSSVVSGHILWSFLSFLFFFIFLFGKRTGGKRMREKKSLVVCLFFLFLCRRVFELVGDKEEITFVMSIKHILQICRSCM